MKDGEDCHELRRASALDVFNRYLPKEDVHLGADSYSAADLVERIGVMITSPMDI
jgi:hypothetical protein